MEATAAPTLNDQIHEALGLADAAPTVRAAAQALRERYAGLRIVVVDAFDMRGEVPAAVGDKVQLFYGASDGHCWTVTPDGRQASGLFLSDKP